MVKLRGIFPSQYFDNLKKDVFEMQMNNKFFRERIT